MKGDKVQTPQTTSSSAAGAAVVQCSLAIGAVNDPLEYEADAMADKVMSMQETPVISGGSENSVQRKCDECEKEEEIQRKPLASFIQRKGSGSGMVASAGVSSAINSSKGSGSTMDGNTQSFMESRFGADFSNVKIHTGGESIQMNRELNAKAFTVGNDIYFNEGQYNPGSDEGKHLLAHELTHTVQQGKGAEHATGENGSIQRYFDANGTSGFAVGKSYRVADDLSMAVKVGYPNHDLYAAPGKAAISNILLGGVGSGIELVEESGSLNVSQGTKTNNLKKVSPKNTQNSTSGDTMKISDDCGNSCAVVVGGRKRRALYHDAFSGTNTRTAASTPSLMKAEIMQRLLLKWLTMTSTAPATRTAITDVLTKAAAKQLEIDAADAAYSAATTEADKKAKLDIYWAKVDEYGNIMMSFYNKASDSERETIDKYLGINKFATPGVGQGYTMSSGGNNYPGTRTWNFHWGGVIMKSNDLQDTVTLENYAVAGDEENSKWDMAMYGNASKKGQTFHEQHHDTKQHGDRPTTMVIEKK